MGRSSPGVSTSHETVWLTAYNSFVGQAPIPLRRSIVNHRSILKALGLGPVAPPVHAERGLRAEGNTGRLQGMKVRRHRKGSGHLMHQTIRIAIIVAACAALLPAQESPRA